MDRTKKGKRHSPIPNVDQDNEKAGWTSQSPKVGRDSKRTGWFSQICDDGRGKKKAGNVKNGNGCGGQLAVECSGFTGASQSGHTKKNAVLAKWRGAGCLKGS